METIVQRLCKTQYKMATAIKAVANHTLNIRKQYAEIHKETTDEEEIKQNIRLPSQAWDDFKAKRKVKKCNGCTCTCEKYIDE